MCPIEERFGFDLGIGVKYASSAVAIVESKPPVPRTRLRRSPGCGPQAELGGQAYVRVLPSLDEPARRSRCCRSARPREPLGGFSRSSGSRAAEFDLNRIAAVTER